MMLKLRDELRVSTIGHVATGCRLTILAASVASILAFSLGASHSAGAAEFVKRSPLTIGYSIQSAQDPYWQGYVHGISDEMKKYGFTKMLTQDSQASPQKQVSGSLALINDGISALIISPHEPTALVATEAAAHRAKSGHRRRRRRGRRLRRVRAL